MPRPIRFLALAISLASPLLAQSSGLPYVQPANETDLRSLIELCQSDISYVNRFYSVPWSEARMSRQEAVYDECEARLKSVDFDRLDSQGRIDYVLLRLELENNRAKLALERNRLAEMDPLLPFRRAITDLELTRRGRKPADWAQAAEAVAKIPEQIQQVRDRIEKARAAAKTPASAPDSGPASAPATTPAAEDALKVSPSLALRTAQAVNQLQNTLDTWSRPYEDFQPEFSWWLTKPREAARNALGEYSKYLRETVAGIKGQPDDPLIGDPIGEAALLADLRQEFIAYSPTELIAIGEREFAWCEEQAKKAAAEMGFADDWKAALAKVKTAYVPAGQQDDLVLDESRSSVEFLKKHDLITIPPAAEEMWRIEMLSADTQKSLPYAVYGGQYVGVAYAAESMSLEDKLMSMRGNNRHFTRIVIPHELIPGHHLQAYHAERLRPYRRQFSTPFFVEGWAVYWEMRLWELSYARGPEDRIGMLFWRMHRCARILVSLKYHLGQMTPQEMIDFLVDRVGHERMGATSEVRRYIGPDYSPLYQCGYMVGAIQVRALHREMVESGKLTDKQFNDRLLTYGPIPIELIRSDFTNQKLTRDATARWKFGDR